MMYVSMASLLTLPVSAASLNRPHLSAEEAQHLVYLVHAQGLFALFEPTHKTESHARLVGKVHLREVELLSHLFHK